MSGVIKRMITAFVGTAPRAIQVGTSAGTDQVEVQPHREVIVLHEDEVVRLIGQMTPEAQLQLITDVSHRMPELRKRRIGETRVGV